MAQRVADTEMIRRQNRQLVLDALRRDGPLSRSQVATATGLSNASLTAIAADLVAEGILAEPENASDSAKLRGRPAVMLTHNREAGYVLLIEIDVNRCRLSLLDYAGVLVDRIESPVVPKLFAETAPADVFIERIGVMLERNRSRASAIHDVSISVQGILDAEGTSLNWSPIASLADADIVGAIADRLGLRTQLFKRGRLMADGMLWLDPALRDKSFATIFMGSTIGMGLSIPGTHHGYANPGTEFGHMIHIPDGALCRCGARGCIEAYAADYAILRSAYSVPDTTAPAMAVPPADYQQIAARARQGDRNAQRAFALAGHAIGTGIGRLISMMDIEKIVVLGPISTALDLMIGTMEETIAACLMGKMRGLPPIDIVPDAGEPVFQGLKMRTLTALDRDFAHRSITLETRRPAQ